MILFAESSAVLVDLAWKDVGRLRGLLKADVPELTLVTFDESKDEERWERVRHGKGPDIRVREGYDKFKEDYIKMEKEWLPELGVELSSLVGPGLVFEHHYSIDSGLNIFGDFMWHKFIILKRTKQ
jgi:hypothetical protein